MTDVIQLGPTLTLPLAELKFSFTRSGGPGGQHVNRSNSKVELQWNVRESPTLNEAQRTVLQEQLDSYITNQGVLRLSANNSRSQFRNRAAVTRRLQLLVEQALRPRQIRRPTKQSKGYHRHRLEKKKLHGKKKGRRKKIDPSSYSG